MRCEICSNQIEDDRLKVLPSTTICSSCAHQQVGPPVRYTFNCPNPLTEKPEHALGAVPHCDREYETLRGKTAAHQGFWSEEYSPENGSGVVSLWFQGLYEKDGELKFGRKVAFPVEGEAPMVPACGVVDIATAMLLAADDEMKV